MLVRRETMKQKACEIYYHLDQHSPHSTSQKGTVESLSRALWVQSKPFRRAIQKVAGCSQSQTFRTAWTQFCTNSRLSDDTNLILFASAPRLNALKRGAESDSAIDLRGFRSRVRSSSITSRILHPWAEIIALSPVHFGSYAFATSQQYITQWSWLMACLRQGIWRERLKEL
jgi:hypothetical protein